MNIRKSMFRSIQSSARIFQSIQSKLVCEIEKTSFASHKISASFAKSQKSIFESAIAFRAIISQENTHLSIHTSENVSESSKNKSTQCSVTSLKSSLSQTFESKHQEISIQKSSIINASLSIDTVNLVCETMKKSTIINSLTSSEASTASTTSQKQIFEIAVSFEAVNSMNRSNSLFLTLDVVFIRMKNESLQCFSISSQNSIQNDVKIDTQKSSAINSSLSISTIDSTCEVTKKSTTVSTAKISKIISKERAESRTRTAYLSSRLKASRLNLSLNTFVTISKTMKNASIQEVACARTMCRSCKQNFNFNNKLFEHIREHEALKRINDFHLSINTVKTACEFVQKSTNICSSSSYESLIFTTSRNLISDTETSLQSVSSKCSNLQLRVLNSASKSTKSTSIQRIVCVRTICKRCKQNFNFNNKLHEHIRQHHARKFVKSSDLRVFTTESTYKIVEKSAIFCSINSQFASSILSATSRSQIFSTEIASRSVSSSDSHFSITTSKITSKSMKKLSANCSLTSSISSSQTSIRKHQKSHIEFYLIVNDLSRMFHEKFKSFDLRQHFNRRSSSQSLDIRQSHFSSFSIKSHLIIENLFEMFNEKFRKKSLFQSQKNAFFRAFFSSQSRITIYFKLTVNQKSSINQDSKNSKSKSLNQHMSAKFIRIAFSKNSSEKSIDLSYKLSDFFYSKDLSEKSVNLSYKLFDVFCINLKSSVETSFFIFVLFRLLSVFFLAFAFVSIISTARMNCINIYEQVISIIDRVIQ